MVMQQRLGPGLTIIKSFNCASRHPDTFFLPLQELPETGGVTLLHPLKGGQSLFMTYYFIKPV